MTKYIHHACQNEAEFRHFFSPILKLLNYTLGTVRLAIKNRHIFAKNRHKLANHHSFPKSPLFGWRIAMKFWRHRALQNSHFGAELSQLETLVLLFFPLLSLKKEWGDIRKAKALLFTSTGRPARTVHPTGKTIFTVWMHGLVCLGLIWAVGN